MERKGLVSCPSLSEKSGQELKTGKWRKEQKQKVGEQCLLAHRLLSLVSHTFQELLSPFYGPSTSIINHENTSQTYIQANLLEAFSQLRGPLPSMSRFVSRWQNTSQHNDLLIFPQEICAVSLVILSLAAYNFTFLIESLICLVYLFFPVAFLSYTKDSCKIYDSEDPPMLFSLKLHLRVSSKTESLVM